jgi:hypothetical protein
VFERLGLASNSQAHWHELMSGKGQLTVAAAARLRAALDGRAAPKPKPIPKSRALVLVKKKPGRVAGMATRKVLEALREDARKAVGPKFGGDFTELAKACELTRAKLDRFMRGSPLTLDEAANVARSVRGFEREERTYPLALASEPVGIEPATARARRLVGGLMQKFGPEALSICIQLAAEGDAAS